MLKRSWKRMLKSRKMLWVLLLCLVAGAVAGTVYKNSEQKQDVKQVAEAETHSGEKGTDAVPADHSDQVYVMEEKESEKAEEKGSAEEKEVKDGQNTDTKKASEDTKKKEAAPASSIIQAQDLDFLTNSALSWPVQGEVLLEFNMDETVYFPTLNLYKCSQAMVIQAEEGTPVCAPAEGIIVSLGRDEQIGNYLVMDIGDGYQVKLGQLKEIKVNEGDLVEEGDLIAYVAAPSECYSVEGDNLYLALMEDGEPVDPLDYLRY